MLQIDQITPDFSIGPQIAPEDIVALKAAGFRSVLNARPDDEAGEYLQSQEAKTLAETAGLAYWHCPTENHAIFEAENADCFESALAEMPKPIFAHCKSGTRAAILWAQVVARHRLVEDVITTLRDAGQDLEFLEQELRDSAEEAKKSPLRLRDDALLKLGKTDLLGAVNSESDS